MVEKIFTYGTLQDVPIQLRLFGRVLIGRPDQLIGYQRSSITLQEEDGVGVYPIAIYTGHGQNIINGVVYEITIKDLKQADIYEGPAYRRVQVELNSGNSAWVYVAA